MSQWDIYQIILEKGGTASVPEITAVVRAQSPIQYADGRDHVCELLYRLRRNGYIRLTEKKGTYQIIPGVPPPERNVYILGHDGTVRRPTA